MKNINHFIKQISKIDLFNSLNEEELKKIFSEDEFNKEEYKKDSIIRFRGSKLNDMLILFSGEIKTEMNDFNGKTIQIEKIKAPAILASGFLFSPERKLPVNIISIKPTIILTINSDKLIKISTENKTFLENLLKNISKKIDFLSQKLWLSSLKTLREKIIFFLIQQMNEQNNDKFIQMNITVEELSKLFGVARPSLSRAFSELENEGIICKNGNRVNIIDKKSMKFNF